MSHLETKEISQKLLRLLETANDACEESKVESGNAKAAYGKAKDTVMAVYSQAISENFSPQEAKQLILMKITNYSQRTLISYLPDEAKDKKMQDLAKRRSLQNCSGNTKHKLLLNSEFAKQIYEAVKSVLSYEGILPSFYLRCDANSVLSVEAFDNGSKVEGSLN